MQSRKLSRASLTVRACPIRDGTPGVSLSIGTDLIGEWTDSRASTLSLTEDFKVAICDADGDRLYLFSLPGRVLSGEQLSQSEVRVSFEIE